MEKSKSESKTRTTRGVTKQQGEGGEENRPSMRVATSGTGGRVLKATKARSVVYEHGVRITTAMRWQTASWPSSLRCPAGTTARASPVRASLFLRLLHNLSFSLCDREAYNGDE